MTTIDTRYDVGDRVIVTSPRVPGADGGTIRAWNAHADTSGSSILYTVGLDSGRTLDLVAAEQLTPAGAALSQAYLLDVICDLTDPDPCEYDHHGHCQAHRWTQTEPACPHARAKTIIGKGNAGA